MVTLLQNRPREERKSATTIGLPVSISSIRAFSPPMSGPGSVSCRRDCACYLYEVVHTLSEIIRPSSENFRPSDELGELPDRPFWSDLPEEPNWIHMMTENGAT